MRTIVAVKPVPMQTIVLTVCRELQIGHEEILGGSRHRRLVLGRELIVALAKALTIMSYPEISPHIGTRRLANLRSDRSINHSTAITAHKRILKQLEWSISARLGEHDAAIMTLPDETVGDLLRRLESRLRRGVA